MIERIYDPAIVNAVSNHPSILPYISCGLDHLDASEAIKDTNNIYLAGEFGIIVFHCIEPGKYEVHVRILPPGRGKWSRGFLFACLDLVFTKWNAEEVRCRVPKGHIACRALVHHMYPEYIGELYPGWVNQDGEVVSARIYSMTKERWKCLKSRSQLH